MLSWMSISTPKLMYSVGPVASFTLLFGLLDIVYFFMEFLSLLPLLGILMALSFANARTLRMAASADRLAPLQTEAYPSYFDSSLERDTNSWRKFLDSDRRIIFYGWLKRNSDVNITPVQMAKAFLRGNKFVASNPTDTDKPGAVSFVVIPDRKKKHCQCSSRNWYCCEMFVRSNSFKKHTRSGR